MGDFCTKKQKEGANYKGSHLIEKFKEVFCSTSQVLLSQVNE